MTVFNALFIPSAASLAAGVKPQSWTIGTDDGDAEADQILQRATSKAAVHLGHDAACYAPTAETAPGCDGSVAMFADVVSDAPVGDLLWVKARPEG